MQNICAGTGLHFLLNCTEHSHRVKGAEVPRGRTSLTLSCPGGSPLTIISSLRVRSAVKGLNRKALDNIDLNLVSHRYVSVVVKDDHFVSARSLLASDPSPRGLFQP